MSRVLVGLAVVVVVAAVVLTVRATDDRPSGSGVATVFLGDSITRGATPDGEAESGSWVTYVVAEPRSPWALEANAGVSGETLGQMWQRFPDDVLERDPEGVVIMGGTNDVFAGVPLEESIAALRRMIEAAESAGIRVWVVAPPPLDAAADLRLAELVEAERDLADELGVPFLDPTPALADGDGGWREGLSYDGVHPTEEGARTLAAAVVEEVSARGSG